MEGILAVAAGGGKLGMDGIPNITTTAILNAERQPRSLVLSILDFNKITSPE